MPGWLKALLIVLVIIIVLVVGVVAAGVFWLYKNKDALVAKTKAITTEARDFGRNTDNQGCVDESISRIHDSNFNEHLHAHLPEGEPHHPRFLRRRSQANRIYQGCAMED